MISESAPLLIASLSLVLSGVAAALSCVSLARRGQAPPTTTEADGVAALAARVDAMEEGAARYVLEEGREMNAAEKADLANAVVETYRKMVMQTYPTLPPREAMKAARRLFNLPD